MIQLPHNYRLQQYNYHITADCNTTTISLQQIVAIQFCYHSRLQYYYYHITVDCNNTNIPSQQISTLQLSHHSRSQQYKYPITVYFSNTTITSQQIATIQLFIKVDCKNITTLLRYIAIIQLLYNSRQQQHNYHITKDYNNTIVIKIQNQNQQVLVTRFYYSEGYYIFFY